MVSPDEIRERIESGLPQARAHVTGDGQHFRAEIVSPAFAGLSRIQQHQLVNAIFVGELGDRIHALSLKTTTEEG
ncbi:MAG: BolA family protein [Solirubrobacteraceae bacterium]